MSSAILSASAAMSPRPKASYHLGEARVSFCWDRNFFSRVSEENLTRRD